MDVGHNTAFLIFAKKYQAMRFITFVKQNAEQEDPALKSFAKYVLRTKNFLLSSDPGILALNLYNKLNPLQTKGFQLFMILYRQQENNQLKASLNTNDAEFLDAINTIIYYQNNNPVSESVAMPGHIPTPQKPYEVLCFYPIELPAANDGNIYLFIAVDVVSKALLQTGMEQTNDINAVLKNIALLMTHDQFKQHKGAAFTLVLHKHEQHKALIEAIIKPYGGRVAFNDLYVTEIVTPPMEFIFEKLATGHA
ncbi:MAG: hypothetical protein DI539_24260 [Flavobacterium psychrophilum]|nr:MAG: hypothetical protein DI539_24260 [Flavobacterium psychrophilum]